MKWRLLEFYCLLDFLCCDLLINVLILRRVDCPTDRLNVFDPHRILVTSGDYMHYGSKISQAQLFYCDRSTAVAVCSEDN
jgi:hypothetical protein